MVAETGAKVLVIGAGFAGAVVARECAETGHHVTVVDRAPWPGGAASDTTRNGFRINRCGAHFFNTSNDRVLTWLSRFTCWLPYEHRGKSRLPDGTLVPFPLNTDSLSILRTRGHDTEPRQATSRTRPARTAREVLAERLGPDVIELFFARYVRKMWDMSLDELPADVMRRVQVRDSTEDRYFPNASFQALPSDGYDAMFRRMLDHPRIAAHFRTPFAPEMERDHDHVFSSMSIDEYFGYCEGTLGYRSMQFETVPACRTSPGGAATVNRTDTSPVTRETHWHHVPWNSAVPNGLAMFEHPRDWRDLGGDRHYPVMTVDGRHDRMYRKYKALAAREAPWVTFIGRCGTYRYLNMDQVVMQSLQTARKWLADRA